MDTLAKEGFVSYKADADPQQKFGILGADSQVVNISLKGGEEMRAEPGSMVFMSAEVTPQCECQPMCGCMQMCAGEAPVKIKYTAKEDAFVALSPNFPAKVIAVPFANGETYKVKGGAYMAEINKVDVSAGFSGFYACCCGGQSCIIQTIKGEPGAVAFIAAGGTVLEKTLAEGEKIIVDTSSLVGWESTVDINFRMAGGVCTICCGGEGLFNTVVSGPGKIWIQSMSFEKFKAAVAPSQAAGAAAGAGGAAAGAAANAGGGPEEIEMSR